MLNLVLGVVVSSSVTPLLMRAGDSVLSRIGTRTRWAGPGPEPSFRFFSRFALGVVTAMVWLAVLFAVSATLYWLFPPSP